MKNSINKIKVFLADEQGAETAEWAVIVGLLVLIGAAVYSPTGTIATAINTLGVKITNAIAG
jgi:Flp pilus assembly pilin Flp